MRDPKIQKWFSKSQLAVRFGVCQKSIERWSQAGKGFPAGRQLPNSRWVWSVAEIEQYEKDLTAAAA
jgi:hypothetical protein